MLAGRVLVSVLLVAAAQADLFGSFGGGLARLGLKGVTDVVASLDKGVADVVGSLGKGAAVKALQHSAEPHLTSMGIPAQTQELMWVSLAEAPTGQLQSLAEEFVIDPHRALRDMAEAATPRLITSTLITSVRPSLDPLLSNSGLSADDAHVFYHALRDTTPKDLLGLVEIAKRDPQRAADMVFQRVKPSLIEQLRPLLVPVVGVHSWSLISMVMGSFSVHELIDLIQNVGDMKASSLLWTLALRVLRKHAWTVCLGAIFLGISWGLSRKLTA